MGGEDSGRVNAGEPDDKSLTGQGAKEQQNSGNPSVIHNDPFHGLSFKVGVAENKNATYRSKMEDVHTYVANFSERLDWGYFAIFDGHAGKDAARWCGNNLHTLLEREILTKEEEEVKAVHEAESLALLTSKFDMREHLNNTFIKADELIQQQSNGSSGCTAAVAVIRWETDEPDRRDEEELNANNGGQEFDFIPSAWHKRMLYTSNVGDSRIVLYRKGKAYRLSYDHKASDINEMNRIRDSGGLIMKNRVNGVLAVTRSLGDSYMKDLVVGNPFTTSTQITSEDEFLILACDGVWDVVTDMDACNFVAESLRKSDNDPHVAAKQLCNLAMENSTTDNVSVMVVKFKDVFSSRSN